MTVTFAPTWQPGDPAPQLPPEPDWDATVEELDDYLDGCEAARRAANGPELNVHNQGAGALLRLLHLTGYDNELSGEIDAAALIARIRAVGRVRPVDPGTPTVEGGGPGTGQCHWVEVGRRPGYLNDRLGDLLQVAEHAQTLGRTVSWS